MKKTKKLLACLIAAATMFTMGSTAFAEETGTDFTKRCSNSKHFQAVHVHK